MPCIQKVVVVRNKLGMHARACASFVKSASGFSSEIRVRSLKGDTEVNGKSILGMMMLAVTPGTEIIIKADGADAQEALDTLIRLVEDGFGEDEI